MEKRLKEIQDRKIEIRSKLESNAEMDFEAIKTELKSLEDEEKEIRSKQEIANKINVEKLETRKIEKPEEKRMENLDKFDSVEYRQAFMAHVLKGKEIPAEFRAAEVTKTSDVGAVIPTTTLNKIVEKIEATGMIFNLVTKTAYKGGVSIPTSSVKPVATWVAQGATSETQKKTTGSVTFAYNKLRCAVAVSLETDTMALSAFEAALVANVAQAMIKAIEQAIISGDGSGKPKGILAETPVTGQALQTANADKFVYADLINLEAAIPSEYETNTKLCMTKKTFMKFIGMVDAEGQPIARVNYGVAGAPERTLLGRPVVICNYLKNFDAATAETDVVAFAFNFEDYILNTNLNIGIKMYEDNETDDIVRKSVMLVDGKVVDVNSLVTMAKKKA